MRRVKSKRNKYLVVRLDIQLDLLSGEGTDSMREERKESVR